MRAALAILVFLLPPAAHAATHRVPSEYATIQAGIDACVEGDTVLVAPGTYTGVGNRDLNFNGTNLTLISEVGAEQTIIDCEGLAGAMTFDHGETQASVVAGFTLRNGASWDSGGIFCAGASPWLHDLIIEEGISWGWGGGVFLRESSAILEDTIIRDNWGGRPDSWGGAGGGLAAYRSAPTIRRVRFELNWAVAGDPGGECCPEAAGGGAYFLESTPTLEDVVFFGNQAVKYTGGNGSNRGGGLFANGDIELRGATFVENHTELGAGAAIYIEGGTLTLERAIIAFSSPGDMYPGTAVVGTTVASCCLAYGNAEGDWVGGLSGQGGAAGNMTADPQFCDRAQGDLSVTDLSPCLPEHNACGLLVGALGMGCLGHAPSAFTASTNRSDGIELVWDWEWSGPVGFEIERDEALVLEVTDPAQRTWLDTEASLGSHAYSLRAVQVGGLGPAASATGRRLPSQIDVVSPNGGEVLRVGAVATLRWDPDSGSDEELVDIELSRSGPDGPWEPLFVGTAHDGEEPWLVTGSYELDCWLRVRSAYSEDISDAAFKIGTRTLRVPLDVPTLADAFAQTASQDTVALVPGLYQEHGLRMPSEAVLLGDPAHPDAVVIDGQGLGRILDCSGVDSLTLIDGVTFQHGYTQLHGAAIDGTLARLTIRNCNFRDNHAGDDGGAIGKLYSSGRLRLLSCTFEDNRSNEGGGAVALHDSRSELTDCRFVGNQAPEGGAISCSYFVPAISFCHFAENRAELRGGAIAFDYTLFAPDQPVRSCVFVGNHSDGDGGALSVNISGPNLVSMTFVGNTADGAGNAIYYDAVRSVQVLDRCLIVGSGEGAAIACGMGGPPTLTCSNLFDPIHDEWAGCAASQLGVSGNISADPLFCDAEHGDYRLDPGSPCLPANNTCGLLIGALGEGCEETPVALASFTATPAAGAVELAWEADALAAFRLTGTREAASWDVAWQAAGSGRFCARDENPQLAPGGEVSYRLEGRLLGEDWQLLRELAVTLPPAFATRLLTPHPNPFNPAVTLPFTLAAPGRVRLEVFDLAGRRVATLADGQFAAGKQALAWDGRDAAGNSQASGVYFIRFAAAGHTESKRLVLLR